MSRFAHLLPFSPLYAFQVCRVVTINGIEYMPGDTMDAAARDALGERRLRQLYERRTITPIAPEALPALLQAGAIVGAGEIAPADGEMATAYAPEGVTLPEGSTGAVINPAASGLTAVHKGFGKWFVVAADGTEEGPMTKEQAQALAGA